MSSSDIQLYVDRRFASPYAMSVFVTLHEKALPFGIRAVDLDVKANRLASYAAVSLTRRVPTLVHGDFSLSESSAICEYLDEVFPEPPVFPRDPRVRARARQIQAWLRSDLMPIRQERSTVAIFYRRIDTPLSAEARMAADVLFAVAETVLPHDAQNLFGEWCTADTDLALMLNRLVMNGDEVPPRLAAYARYQWQRPSVQRWVEQERPPL